MADSKSNYIPLTATVAVCCLVTAGLFWKQRNREIPINDPNEVIVSLLPIERTLASGGGGDNNMSTLTWLQGDYRKAATILETRAKEILQANPWLSGRIVRRNRSYVLAYNPTNLHVEDHFHLLENEDKTKIERNQRLDTLGTSLSHILLKNGPTQPLWKVSIIPCDKNPDSSFGLVFSMSHIVADGATFYKIQNMLTFAQPVQKLIATRIESATEQQIQAMGGAAEHSVLSSAGFVVQCIGGVLKTLLKGPKAEMRFYLIDAEAMDAVKQEAVKEIEDGVPFVSTNDVLTSWFLQNSSCKYGMMALNFRGRLDKHTDQLAGNYENVIFYKREDSTSPGLIRKSLDKLKRVNTGEGPMPTFIEMATGSVALASNWSSFVKPASIQGCREEMHMPLYDIASLLPSTMAIMIPFRAGPHGTAIYLGGIPERLDGLRDAPFLSKRIVQL